MRARGIDVSEYNNVDWSSVRTEDASFVGIRSSSGGGTSKGVYTDKSLASHHAGAGSINALRFPYHYCMMSNPPEEEAEALWRVICEYEWELPVGLDVEYQNDLLSIPIDTQVDWIVRCGNRIAELSQRLPMVYSFKYQFSDQWVKASRAKELGTFGYWPADLSKGAPPAENALPYIPTYEPTWWFWQCSGNINGTTQPTAGSKVLPGFHGMAIDQNVFNGDLASLQRFSQTGLFLNPDGSDPMVQNSLAQKLAAIQSAKSSPITNGVIKPLLVGGAIVGGGYLAVKHGPSLFDWVKNAINRKLAT